MRVTQQMLAGNLYGNLNQLRAKQASLTEQISSGDRITRVSEDISAGAEVMRIQSRNQSLNQWKASLNNSRSWVYATEAKLGDITDLLNSAKELALAASNGTASDETRKALAPAAEQLFTDLVAALNEKEPEGFLFAGFQTDLTGNPFSVDSVTGAVTYQGDTGVMRRDVGPGVQLEVNLPGNRLLNAADPDNMAKALWDLKTALKTPVLQANNRDTNGDGVIDADANGDLYIDEDADSDGITDTPTASSKLMPQSDAVLMDKIKAIAAKLDHARQNVVTLRSEMGGRQVQIEALTARLQKTEVQLSDALQQAQGVDMTKALLELSSAETTYRAALQVGGRILPQSLADFLR